MTLYLKQSTSIDIRIGPFVDATDAVTPETGITLGAADQAEVLKANGAATVAMAGAFVAVTGADGWYDYTVATGDVDTVGEVVFVVQDSSVCLPVFVRAQVIEEAVFDKMYLAAADGPLQSTVAARALDVSAAGTAGVDHANITGVMNNADVGWIDSNNRVDVGAMAAGAISSGVISAAELTNIENEIWNAGLLSHNSGGSFGQAFNGIVSQTGSVNDAGALVGDFDVDGFSEGTDDHFNGSVMTFTNGALNGQSRVITDYNGGTQNCVFDDPWTDAPVNNDQFIISPPGTVAGAGLANVYRLFLTVLNQSTGQLDSGTLQANCIGSTQIDANAIGQSELASNAIGSDQLASSAVNKIWDEPMTETTGAPAITGSLRNAFEWMFALSRNKITQTATLTTLRNDADGADLATSVVADDATTYTRNEWSV